MEILNKKNNSITLKVELEESLANAIRRYLNQIEVLAIEDVEILNNGSPLYDETIAHRLGLIPIESSKIPKGDLNLNLKSKKEGLVLSGELQGNVKVVYDKIPITYLGKGQEFEINANIKPGKGSNHAKFSPGLMFYRESVEIKVGKDCPKKIVEICPKKIFEVENGKIIVKNSEKCDLCNACIEFCKRKKKEFPEIKEKNELIVTIEKFGQLEIPEMVKKSIDALKKDLAEISKSLK